MSQQEQYPGGRLSVERKTFELIFFLIFTGCLAAIILFAR
ncbi:hypothetical protein Desti_1860 [Desulfomonile tiedjei DSM 6799]|uniref:Uncharacterized protein n=1 Tax=Desulfomonile tiedjei (strain ATCC 49306 / DSM 6799 / DCB-1) TaxID=706587 RepID=I4C4S7_DESTA|nr:hypothetical protein Desti_1860 [Desulfomonile tiedjei DSM 6799]